MADAAAAIWEEIRLRYLRGGPANSRQRRFTARANNLWRVAQGSNAAVFKKIHNGGTHDRKQLGNQLDYLFSKAEAVFGNMVEHDPDRRTLTREERKSLSRDWEDSWRGDPKNGHTTHLLLSFPADVAPERAKLVAEIWAAEMFQSGAHADDEWAYVAALHTDRSHPHVHIVVNNRGIVHDSWFYMAKGHAFELIAMKERMVGIAAEQGLYLDSSSRIERGKLTYGPSRAELENALREGRDVYEKPLQGEAMRDALAQIRQNVTTLDIYSSLARQLSDDELAASIFRMARTLERGGIISTPKEDFMQAEAVRTRGDLAQYYDKWLERAERAIKEKPVQEQRELRRELYEVASDVSKTLGDIRDAELMQQPARDPVHASRIGVEAVGRAGITRDLGRDGVAEIQDRIAEVARLAGLDPAKVTERMTQGAANAWQERDWTRQDILTVARSRKLDLETESGRRQTAGIVDAFYEKTAQLLDRSLEQRTGTDRLTRVLTAMSESMRQSQSVEFCNDEHAERFARDLKERYGENLMERLAKGDDRALAIDIRDGNERRAAARAIVAAAERHESIGMSLTQVREARARLQGHEMKAPERSRETGHDRDQER